VDKEVVASFLLSLYLAPGSPKQHHKFKRQVHNLNNLLQSLLLSSRMLHSLPLLLSLRLWLSLMCKAGVKRQYLIHLTT
jgi:hypothetical protein